MGLRTGHRCVGLPGLLLSAFLSAAAGAQPVAMITDLSGPCRVSEGATERACGLLDSLAPGAELVLEGDARVTLVYFSGSDELQFEAPARLRLGPREAQVLDGTVARTRSLGKAGATGISALAGMNLGQAALVLRGRGQKRLRLISPVDTVVLDGRDLSFRWESETSDAQYRFTLTHESGRRMLETLLRGRQFSLPAEVVLEPDVYYEWQVETRLASGESYAGSADFSIASQDLRDSLTHLRPDSSASLSERIIYAAALEHHGVHEAATARWRALRDAYPGNPALERLAR